MHREHKKLQLKESVSPHSHLLDLLHIVVPAAQKVQYPTHRKVAQKANVTAKILVLFFFFKLIFFAMSQQAVPASSTENLAQGLKGSDQ